MTALQAILRDEIVASGPVSVARYMELCLGHPQHGYYRTRDPLGAAGDFTTAPEISQMFGEMIGAWVASVWDAAGRPDFRLVELGPGRGTLMADVLRVLGTVGARPEIWLVETSPTLRAAQATAVPGANWADRPEDVPDGPAIVIANEFLDALPVRQFLCGPRGWSERLVGLRDGQLAWGLSPPLPGDGREGAWREMSDPADRVLDWIAGRLQAAPGAALIVDYGYRTHDRPPGPTLQAVRSHARVDALEHPGQADLTWLIDFDHCAHRLPGGLVADQGAFLATMGIGARAAALAARAPGDANAIADALERLTAPDQMGTLFKALSSVSPGVPRPPGFSGDDNA